MTIDYAIHSSDSNPFYLDFWPVVSEIWKKKFNITPILVYIDDKEISIDETYGIVIKLKPINGIPLYLQNLWVRYWIPSKYPDKVSIISDIDMLPLSIEYFEHQIAQINANKYVHINPCLDTYGTLPSCYHIAKGVIFKTVLCLHDTWEESIKYLFNLNLGSIHQGTFGGGASWFADERFATSKVLEPVNDDVRIFVNRNNGQNGYRIDRNMWVYSKLLLSYDYYYDLHSIRPYSLNKMEIDNIKNIALAANKQPPPFYLVLVIEAVYNFRYFMSKLKNNLFKKSKNKS